MVPCGILWVTPAIPQASALSTLKVRSGNTLVQRGPLAIVVSPQHVITGGVTSLMVTVDWQVEVLPDASATVKVTRLGPTLLQLKVLGKTLTSVTAVQLSTLPLFTIAGVIVALPEAFRFTVIGLQIATGGVASTRFTVKLHVDTLPLPSVASITMVRVPP